MEPPSISAGGKRFSPNRGSIRRTALSNDRVAGRRLDDSRLPPLRCADATANRGLMLRRKRCTDR